MVARVREGPRTNVRDFRLGPSHAKRGERAPVYDSASEANPDIVFGKVDTDAEQNLAGAMRIMSIPTLMIFRDGIGVFSQAGALPRPALDDLIGQVRALDMDAVRAEIEKAASPA